MPRSGIKWEIVGLKEETAANKRYFAAVKKLKSSDKLAAALRFGLTARDRFDLYVALEQLEGWNGLSQYECYPDYPIRHEIRSAYETLLTKWRTEYPNDRAVWTPPV